ncbi:MAG: metallophosphoesterase family protein [bacterium]|nr:metallophosphoesterase family protein [bacterium]
MRVALLSDIHGNRIALDAVIADARRFGVDTFCVVGDLAAIGPEPVSVLECLVELENITIVRGNTDRYIVTDEGPSPTLEQAQVDARLIDLYARVTASFAWTRGVVTAAGWFDWLKDLPIETRIRLEDGTQLLAVHASPGSDEDEGVHPGRSNADLAVLFNGCTADIVCVGHTHDPVLRYIGDRTVVNLGCVSNPVAPDLRASYVILDSTKAGASIHHRRVAYDRRAFVEAVHRSRHPEGDFILSHQRSERAGRTPHGDHVVPVPSTPAAQ